MTAKHHYENHLGNFYSWMLGDFEERAKEQKAFFETHKILPGANCRAIDLGTGEFVYHAAHVFRQTP